jgi:pimeloyl-ACP methyl ester carboxylesterase
MSVTTTPSGVQLAYESIGDPQAPAMLLIQGLGAQMIGWRAELCSALAAEGFHVIRFDNRDSGLSQKFADGSYLISDMADDAAGLLDALRINRAHVVGQSFGGMIAQELAIRRSEKVLSLCLVYTAPNTHHFLQERDHGAPAQRAPAGSREEAIEQYLADESFCASSRYAFDVDWIRTLGGQIWDRCYYPEGIARQLAAASRSPDRSVRLSSVNVPTLVVHGEADRLIDVRGGLALAEAMPHAHMLTVAGMGHELPRPIWPILVGAIVGNAQARGDGHPLAFPDATAEPTSGGSDPLESRRSNC